MSPPRRFPSVRLHPPPLACDQARATARFVRELRSRRSERGRGPRRSAARNSFLDSRAAEMLRSVAAASEPIVVDHGTRSPGYFALRDRPETMPDDTRRDCPADLITVSHRVRPMEPSPHSRIVDFAHQGIEIVVRPFRLNDLGHSGRGGHDRPRNLVGPKERGGGISDRGRPESMRRGYSG